MPEITVKHDLRNQASTRGRHTRKLRKYHDVADPGWRGLRSASRRSASHHPAALYERLLARPGDDARHDRPGLAILSGQFADLGTPGLAACAGQDRPWPRRQ